MNKIFSILLCCIYLGTSHMVIFGKDHEKPRPVTQQPPTQPNSPAQQIRIPGIPDAMQPTNRQAIQARAQGNITQLHQVYIAQVASRIVTSVSVGTQTNLITTPISNTRFSESELSSEVERAQSPRPARAFAQQNNLPNPFYTQVHSNPRNFVGQARARVLIMRLSPQNAARLRAAYRRQELNDRHNYYDAQD